MNSKFILVSDLKSSTGRIFPKGSEVEVKPFGVHGIKVFHQDHAKAICVKYERASVYLQGFPKPPSQKQIERWYEQGICQSVDGKRVEPDGYSPNEWPSWMIVMGV